MITNCVLIKTPEEYALALGIRKKVFVEEQGVPESLEVDEFEDSAHHFLLTKDAIPAAASRLRIKGDMLKFERIATLKEFRGLGLGRLMMECMESFAAKTYPHLGAIMHAQQDAIGFYTKLGWVPQGDVFFEAGIPHRVLSKKLI